MEFSHIPVLLEQAVDALAVKENGIYVDGTAGGGGHSSEILSRLTTGKLISIDQDPDAILTLTERFKKNENSRPYSFLKPIPKSEESASSNFSNEL